MDKEHFDVSVQFDRIEYLRLLHKDWFDYQKDGGERCFEDWFRGYKMQVQSGFKVLRYMQLEVKRNGISEFINFKV